MVPAQSATRERDRADSGADEGNDDTNRPSSRADESGVARDVQDGEQGPVARRRDLRLPDLQVEDKTCATCDRTFIGATPHPYAAHLSTHVPQQRIRGSA